MAQQKNDLSSWPKDVTTGYIFPNLDIKTLYFFGATSKENYKTVTNYLSDPLPSTPQEEKAVRIKYGLNPFLNKENISEWKEKLAQYRQEKLSVVHGIFFKLKGKEIREGKTVKDFYFIGFQEAYYQHYLFSKNCEHPNYNFGTLDNQVQFYFVAKKMADENQLDESQKNYLINSSTSKSNSSEEIEFDFPTITQIKKIPAALLDNLVFFAACIKQDPDSFRFLTYVFPKTLINDSEDNTNLKYLENWTPDHFQLLEKIMHHPTGSFDKKIQGISNLSNEEVIARSYGTKNANTQLENIWQFKLYYEFQNKYSFPSYLCSAIQKASGYIQNEKVYDYLRHRLLEEKDVDKYEAIFNSLEALSKAAINQTQNQNTTASVEDKAKENTSSYNYG